MQSNLSVTSYKPSFGIKTSEQLINALEDQCRNISKPDRISDINRKVDWLAEQGFDSYTISYKIKKGQKTTNTNKHGLNYVLYASQDRKNSRHIELATHNRFRQLIGEFLNLNENHLNKLAENK